MRQLKFLDSDGIKTLEKEEKLDYREYDTQHSIDPLFKQITQRFDDGQAGNLLGSTLNINSDLSLQLDSQMEFISQKEDKKQISTSGFNLRKLNSFFGNQSRHAQLMNVEEFKSLQDPQPESKPVLSHDLDMFISHKN